jgi:leader peptidase (prepilin peptidase)/N-methyltransferase
MDTIIMTMAGLWFFIIGAAMGSFFNVLIVRLPKGQNIVTARSMCSNCHTQLKWYDLIPIFSFLLLKGKCRYCGQKLSYQYLISELTVGGLFLMAFLIQGRLFSYSLTIFYLALWSMLFVVGVMDYREGIIIDQVMIPFVIIASIVRLTSGDSIMDLLLGAATGFALYFLIYLLARLFYKKEGFGMGDVILLTAIGFFFSPAKTILIGILAFYCCLFFLLALWLFKNKLERHMELPFAPSVCLAAFIVSLAGDSILAYLHSFLRVSFL